MELVFLVLSAVLSVSFILRTVMKDRKDYFNYYNKK